MNEDNINKIIEQLEKQFVKNQQRWGQKENDVFVISGIHVKKDEVLPVFSKLIVNENKDVRRIAIWALSATGKEYVLELLPELIKSMDFDEDRYFQNEIINALKSAIPDSIIRIVKIIKNEKEKIKTRIKAAYTLEKLEKDAYDAVPLLRDYVLNVKNEQFRISLVNAFGHIKNPIAIDILSNLLINDKVNEVRASAAKALGRIRDIKALPYLEKALNDKVSSVRKNASESIGLIAMRENVKLSKDCIEKLTNIMISFDESWQVREEAAWSLGKAKICDTLDPLNDILMFHDNNAIRITAIEIINYLHASGCSEAENLMKLLLRISKRDSDERVRIEAFKALEAMCKRLDISFNNCIKALKPEDDIEDAFWDDPNISGLESLFDESKSNTVENKVILSIHYLVYTQNFRRTNPFGVYSLLQHAGFKITHIKASESFADFEKKGMLSEPVNGKYRLSEKGREHIRKLQLSGKKTDDEQNEFLSQLEPIEELYARYKKELEEIWKKHPFEKSIFVMMPFRFDQKVYQEIRDAIKKATKEEGFNAFLSIDDDRNRIRPSLWENLVVNMLSCKYGIAVLPSEKISDALDEHKLKIFNNPNVALEFGFMYLKGEHDVLLLTQSVKDLPADVKGLLVEKFNFDDPFDDVYRKVKKWLSKKK